MCQDHDGFVGGTCTHVQKEQPTCLNRWDGVLNPNIPFASMDGTLIEVNTSVEEPDASRHNTPQVVHTPRTRQSGQVTLDLRTPGIVVVSAHIVQAGA